MEVVNNSIKEENQDIKHNTKLLLILKAISILFSICLSIAGIIIISKDDDANHGCNDIWQLTVLSVVSTLLTLSNNCVSYKKKHNNIEIYLLISVLILTSFILHRFYTISDECETYYTDNFPDLWYYFYILVVINIIAICIIIIVIFYAMYIIFKKV